MIFKGGIIRVTWRNLRPYIKHERKRSGSQKNWEWVQWLAEQLEHHGSGRPNLKIGARMRIGIGDRERFAFRAGIG